MSFDAYWNPPSRSHILHFSSLPSIFITIFTVLLLCYIYFSHDPHHSCFLQINPFFTNNFMNNSIYTFADAVWDSNVYLVLHFFQSRNNFEFMPVIKFRSIFSIRSLFSITDKNTSCERDSENYRAFQNRN